MSVMTSRHPMLVAVGSDVKKDIRPVESAVDATFV